ncbi:MAG: o-succinylbenzoate synthase [Bacteroidales bacterium]|nr:o-succinylbenzoate synthase [Bacteroidales bacterium]
MLKAFWKKHTLNFKQASGTSRGIFTEKDSWYIFIYEENSPDIKGIGECGLLKGLSCDDLPEYEGKIEEVCSNINHYTNTLHMNLKQYPSIRFGLEMALLDLKNKGNHILFPTKFTEGKSPININGLIWMGEPSFMKKQIKDKLKQGFSCLKMKIGAIDFEEELSIIKEIRNEFPVDEIELRVDANGAFSKDDAPMKLHRLAEYQLHSIEQPIKAGQWEEMALLCKNTPLPIALDEELIGIHETNEKQILIETIKPQYIILKPSLLGGIESCNEWINIAEQNNCGWWVTSALESNVGLNAIAQWTYTLNNPMPQGLGTGQLYTNNFESPLEVKKGFLNFDRENNWDLSHML